MYCGDERDGENLVFLDDNGNISGYGDENIEDYGVKLFSFADTLKNFCTDVLGVEHHKVWGTQEQKEELTHIKWGGLPENILYHWSEEARGKKPDSGKTLFCGKADIFCGHIPTGQMSGREIMQVFGTDMIRAWYYDAWAEATFRMINRWFSNQQYVAKPPRLALVCDGRFPNEISAGIMNGAKTIRLLRDPNEGKDQHASETALDDYPLDKYSLVIDNRDMSVKEQNDFLKPYLIKWFGEL